MTTTHQLSTTETTLSSVGTRDPRPIRTHLLAAVLCALICFPPLGVAALVHAAGASTRLALGDLDGARRSAHTAARLCWASGLVQLGFLLVIVIGAGTYGEVH